MKAKALIFLSVYFLISCTKTKIEKIEIDKTDTVSIQKTLIGEWTDGQETHLNPIFTGSTLQWGYETPYYYLTSSDTIYAHYTISQTVFPEFKYIISKNNDSLILKTIVNVFDSYTRYYHRIK